MTLFLFLSSAESKTTEPKANESRSYNDYFIKIKDLYLQSLKLSKTIKEKQFAKLEGQRELPTSAQADVQKSINDVAKYCSASYESQIYFDSQKQNRQKEKYEYTYNQVSKELYNTRLEIYKKCKRMKALLSRMSFEMTQKSADHITRTDLQSHEGLFNQTQHVYKELLTITSKLSLSQSYEAQKNIVGDYQIYKDFDCDWAFERELYLNAKTFLKSQLVNARKIVNEDRKRGLASSSPSFKYENILNDLESRHASFEKICEEILHSKDRINAVIKKLY